MADALYFSVAVRGTYADIQSSQKALEGQILNKVSLTPRAGYGIKCTNIQILLKHSQLVSPLFGCNCTALVKK